MSSHGASPQRACWVVRAGPGARDLDLFRRSAFIGLSTDIGGAVATENLAELAKRVVQSNPGVNSGKALGLAAMLHAFASEIQIGDVVLTPAKGGGSLLLGSVVSSYRYMGETDTGYLHVRDVEWHGQLQLSAVPEQARSGLRAPLTLFRPGAQALLVSSVGMTPRD